MSAHNVKKKKKKPNVFRRIYLWLLYFLVSHCCWWCACRTLILCYRCCSVVMMMSITLSHYIPSQKWKPMKRQQNANVQCAMEWRQMNRRKWYCFLLLLLPFVLLFYFSFVSKHTGALFIHFIFISQLHLMFTTIDLMEIIFNVCLCVIVAMTKKTKKIRCRLQNYCFMFNVSFRHYRFI